MALRRSKQSRGKSYLFFFLLALLAIGSATIFVLFFEGNKPGVNLIKPQTSLGKYGEIHIQVSDAGSGLRSIAVSAEQGSVSKVLLHEEYPRTAYQGAAGPLEVEKSVNFAVAEEGFADGELTLTVKATDFSWRGWFQGNKTVIQRKVTIDTEPPRLQILHSQRYLLQGGSGIAIYQNSDSDARHGVELANRFHPGFPIGDGRDDTYIAYFAMPYDLQQLDNLQVVATDVAGNNAAVSFKPTVKKSAFKKDSITISDSFLEAKIPEFEQYAEEMTGDSLEKYLYTNQIMRVENNRRISQLCDQPSAERYWQGNFRRMPGASRAGFADHRTYLYHGQVIDQQVHLGVDIASTRNAEVRAANAGRVIFADYLGIYGNMVLVDHGQGIFSLYSHLSQMRVSPGDMVDTTSVLGLTGTSGMAGGDHLHFSVLINGEFVTPVEWWDQNWLEVNIEEP
ncbi:MAG: M23 family metallopeptidase, partial [Desulforhopalus sp.]|nr:M23 family metallopeptidase [Desulforhopalus sp.]